MMKFLHVKRAHRLAHLRSIVTQIQVVIPKLEAIQQNDSERVRHTNCDEHLVFFKQLVSPKVLDALTRAETTLSKKDTDAVNALIKDILDETMSSDYAERCSKPNIKLTARGLYNLMSGGDHF